MIVHKSFKYYHLHDVQFAHNSRSMTFAAAGRILEKTSIKEPPFSKKCVESPYTNRAKRVILQPADILNRCSERMENERETATGYYRFIWQIKLRR